MPYAKLKGPKKRLGRWSKEAPAVYFRPGVTYWIDEGTYKQDEFDAIFDPAPAPPTKVEPTKTVMVAAPVAKVEPPPAPSSPQPPASTTAPKPTEKPPEVKTTNTPKPTTPQGGGKK